jgi:apolipoprotein N-acyltransferase
MNKKIRIPLLTFSLLLLLAGAYQLSTLPLWSWWSLVFLVGFWGSWVFAALPLYTRPKKGLRWLGLSTLSGVFLALGFPISPMTPLIFVAFVPLFFIVEELEKSEVENKKRYLMRYAYNAFAIWNILATFWVSNAGLFAGMIANFLNAFFMCLPFLAYYISRKRLGENLGYFAMICFWFSWEYLHLNWDLSWTWLTLGNAFAQQPSWVQWYEYTGVFGGGLWIFLANIFIFKSVKNGFSWNKKLIAPLAILVLPLIFSYFIKTSTFYETSKKNVEIVAIQPNYEPHYQKFEVHESEQLERFLSLSKKNISDNTSFLIFPETSFGNYDIDQLEAYAPIRSLQEMADNFPNLSIVTGLDMFKLYNPNEPNLAPTVRIGKGRAIEFYNGATQFTKGQNKYPIYKKSKLVPGAEILPFRWAFGWLKPLFLKFGGTVEGCGSQPERSVFWNKNGIAIAPVICYESIYGEYCGDYVRHGAQALFIMTNDGWWDDTPGYLQHLDFAKLRAIELRKNVVRAANTGSSAIINSYGEVEKTLPYNEAGAVKGVISLNSTVTFYALYGDYLAKIGIFFSVLIAAFVLYKKYRHE